LIPNLRGDPSKNRISDLMLLISNVERKLNDKFVTPIQNQISKNKKWEINHPKTTKEKSSHKFLQKSPTTRFRRGNYSKNPHLTPYY
jgi:hypothetical protein